MPTARFQPSFAAGVLAPGLHGRIDIAKYDVGLKVGVNVFIHAHGGVSNRAGFEFIAEVMDSTKKHRLIPFLRDDNENYVMLMGDNAMRIIQNGAVLQDGGSDYTPATPYASTDIDDLDYVQSIDVMFFAHQGYAPQEMSRTALISWTFADLVIDPTIAQPTGLAVVSSGAGSETYTYKVSPVVDGVEGFSSGAASYALSELLSLDGAKNLLSWTGTADSYNVYRERGGLFGYVGFSDTTDFKDDNISPDLTVTPIEASDLFGALGDWPAAVTLAQQRLIFGNTVNQPETLFASRSGDFRNFTRSAITRATDRIELDVIGETVNRIRSMLQLRELLVFASNGEFSVSGPNGTLQATNPAQVQFAYSGSAKVKPIVIEDTALFVDRTGRSVRDLRYAFAQDGYSGNDLSIFAPHFFEGRAITGWAFSKNPYSVVWVHLDNGKLLSFTYKREHQVWAWCEHDVGGQVESIAVAPEAEVDAVYIIVKRTINGTDRRYVERLNDRSIYDNDAKEAFFLDSGKTYRNDPGVTALTGLDHLEGETLVALADGNVITGLVVTGGAVTLAKAAKIVHIGLPYVAEIENLPPAVDLQDVGSARGRPIKANRVFVQLERTRGIEVAGTSRAKFSPLIQTGTDLSADIPLFTGMVEIPMFPEWNKDGTIVIRQPFPLPMSILGISPELTVGRTG